MGGVRSYPFTAITGGGGAAGTAKSSPVTLRFTVREATRSSAASRPQSRAPRPTLNAGSAVYAASAVVPVTKVPIGKVKLHHVSANGRPWRMVRP